MKTLKMTIRLTEYEKKKLEQEATKRGMNQSEVLRSLIARFPERAPRRLCRIPKTLCKIHPGDETCLLGQPLGWIGYT
ncbi:CopG family transcriptional regulator [Moorena producens]|uniref:ribbon-helix-helix domain-containing protein n=1 Tax=Moorena producens TaxID=1155739 RepID=UPI0009F5E9C2|nr:CopG family transcriptional regulator [Moorena producens]